MFAVRHIGDAFLDVLAQMGDVLYVEVDIVRVRDGVYLFVDFFQFEVLCRQIFYL